ncbi:MAG: hypothetical protein R3F59_22845 [Myxococcota bacterium]
MSLLFLLSCAGTAPPAPPPAPSPRDLPAEPPDDLGATAGEPVRVEGRDLRLRLGGAVVVVPYLSARLVPAGAIVDLEHRDSFEVAVDALEVRIPEQALGDAVRGLGDDDGPLRDLRITADGDVFTGTGHARALGVPFSLRADPGVTDDGALFLALEQAKVLGVGVRGFLGALQGPIEAAAERRGTLLDVSQGELRVDPFPFQAPPVVHATFTSAEVTDGALVARLGEAPSGEAEPGLALQGGILRSGNTVPA